MASDTAVSTEPIVHHPAPTPAHPKRRGFPWGLVVVVAIAGAVGAAWFMNRGRETKAATHGAGHEAAGEGPAGVSVDVIHPKKGGMERISDMTGSVHPFEMANIYANVSGYLKSQEVEIAGTKVMVDIGVHVKKGDVLAIIDVPEVFAARDQAKAEAEQAEAQAKQAAAHVETAEADLKAAQADVSVAKANVGRYTAQREETRKAFARYQGLRNYNSVDQDVVDQKQDAFESAQASEDASKAAVIASDAKVIAARAKIDQAKADLKAAESAINVAKAKLSKAQVFVDYTTIRSPYTGVITARNFFPGDFIRSASDGNGVPLLTVARTDVMRIRTKLSDLDVPYADIGDPAVVTVDALPGVKLDGKVARFSESESPTERTMLTEIDIPNLPDSPSRGRLRDGMYGLAMIQLTKPSGHITIPVSCLVGPVEGNKNGVLVARDNKAHHVTVSLGGDDGREVEVLQGLKDDDTVIVPNGNVADGTPVVPIAAPAAAAPASSH